MSNNASNNANKRSVEETSDVETKKTKVEHPSSEQTSPMLSNATNVRANFVSAATLARPIPEISDEELLAFVLEFERNRGI
jgi:hypothetical protein